MANRIKGITVEINGDTTKLSKALESVNKNIKSTQTQLKDVEKLLKLDPTNTELLSQKQKLLADAVSSTKEKLETLKTAAKQANTALANGDITQEQYDALQREIIETEQELQSLEQQAKQSGTALTQMAQTGEKLKTVGTNISNAGQALLPLTGMIVGLGNEKSTPDSLGPISVSNIIVTNHFYTLGINVEEGFRSTAVFSPGVMGQTGIETSDIIHAVVNEIKPDFIIVVDALKASSIDRVNKTIQITDAGINPGSGIGNNRKEIRRHILK